jgi:RNA polymerase sigma factor (sigma-70 family)
MSLEEDYKAYWRSMCQGDKEALNSLYNSLYFHLIRFGLKICGDDELVKDCINQLFLNLWDKRKSLNPVENVRAYLFTILKHAIADELKHHYTVNNALQKKLQQDQWSELSYEEIVTKVQQDEELSRKLQVAIQQLTPKQIELIKLKFFDGLSYEQISLQTSQSIKTAYNTVYDAIRMLRKLLK